MINLLKSLPPPPSPFTKMNMFKQILTNGYIPLIPILIWNYIFISKLPLVYQPQFFNHEIPILITVGENLFRTIIFIMPLFFKLSFDETRQMKGLFVFIIGVLLYFISWLILMYMPDSTWSNNIFIFSAPAYTPIIWLIGLSMMVERYYFFRYSKWHYITPSILFSIFHIYHSIYVFDRVY